MRCEQSVRQLKKRIIARKRFVWMQLRNNRGVKWGRKGERPVKKWMFVLLAACLLAAGAPSAPPTEFPTMARIRWEEADGATLVTIEKGADGWRLEAVRCGRDGAVRRSARAVTRDRDPWRRAAQLVRSVGGRA